MCGRKGTQSADGMPAAGPLTQGKPMHLLSSFSRPVAIVLLPPVGFFFERALDEPITDAFGPALYALYTIGVISYAAVALGERRLPAAVTSLAAGVLLAGTLIVGSILLIGSFAALFLLLMALPRLDLGGAMSAVVLLSPWFAAEALREVSTRSLCACGHRLGRTLTGFFAIAGIGFAIGLASAVTRADAAWLAPRLKVFDGDDVESWEKTLSEIKGNWLCGHRRCLMKVCFKLDVRFGRTMGESGFASPMAFVVEAPDVPDHLGRPFEKIYGYRVRQVCVIGD